MIPNYEGIDGIEDFARTPNRFNAHLEGILEALEEEIVEEGIPDLLKISTEGFSEDELSEYVTECLRFASEYFSVLRLYLGVSRPQVVSLMSAILEMLRSVLDKIPGSSSNLQSNLIYFIQTNANLVEPLPDHYQALLPQFETGPSTAES